MQENTESEIPEGSSENEVHAPEAEESVAPEDCDSSEPNPNFEEQNGEFLPPEEKKKSVAGKVFLFLVIILAGLGSYIYFNNLIPPKILNLVLPKSAPSNPPALVTTTPSFIEEIAEIPEPVEVVESPVSSPVAGSLGEMKNHISGNELKPTPHISGGNELKPTPYISDSKTQLTPINEVETINPEEAQHEVTVGSRALEAPEEAEPAITEELVEVATLNREPITKTLPPSTLTEPAGPQRSKASQAYLDFIESSVQKLGKLVLEGFNWCWDYLKEKSS